MVVRSGPGPAEAIRRLLDAPEADPGDWIDACAALARHPVGDGAEGIRRALARACTASCPDPRDFAGWLSVVGPPPDPAGGADELVWLGRVRSGPECVRALDEAVEDEAQRRSLRQAIESWLAEATQHIVDHPKRWKFRAGVAAPDPHDPAARLEPLQALAGLGEVVPEAGEPDPAPWVDAWMVGTLAALQAAAVAGHVTSDSAWRGVYRAAVDRLAVGVTVVHWDPAWGGPGPFAVAPEPRPALLDVPLPHRGPGARLLARVTPSGTVWDATGCAATFVPWGSRSFRCEDRLFGWMEVPIHEVRPTPREELERGWQVLVEARASGAPVASELGRALARRLLASPARGALALVEGALAVGQHSPGGLARWPMLALGIRLDLGDMADETSDAALARTLDGLDLVFAATGAALFALEDGEYEDLVAGRSLDEDRWWGFRARVERVVPEPMLVQAARQAAAAAARPPILDLGALAAHEEFEGARREIPAPHVPRAFPYRVALAAEGAREAGEPPDPGLPLPCPWLRRTRFGAALDALSDLDPADPDRLAIESACRLEPGSPRPRVGTAPLLVWDPALGQGRLLEVRLAEQPNGSLWGANTWFGRECCESFRRAFWAVAALCPDGVPPRSIERHRMELLPLGEPIALDGESAGLAFALALASLWSGRPLPADVAASAGVGASGRLEGVGRIPEKAAALVQAWGRDPDPRPRLLVAPGNTPTAARADVAWQECGTVEAALQHCGIEPSHLAGQGPDFGTVDELRTRARELIHTSQPQDLDRFRAVEGAEPWALLGDALRACWRELIVRGQGRADSRLAARCRIGALAAYLHAGADSDARALLPRDAADAPDDPLLAAHLAGLALSAAIDDRIGLPPDLPAVQRDVAALDVSMAAVPAADAPLLQGCVWGTQGRAFLHAGQPDRAIPLLAGAVAHHQAIRELAREVPRSRIYLAMALRADGRLDQAAEQLHAAEAELVTVERDESGPYARSTRVFLHYEQARLALAKGHPDAALRYARSARHEASWRGSWPLAGVLRTLAQAATAAGQPVEALEAISVLESLASAVRPDPGSPHPPVARLFHRLLAEARGEAPGPGDPGEAY